eukprot:1208561-Prymnesium_polylepis.1
MVVRRRSQLQILLDDANQYQNIFSLQSRPQYQNGATASELASRRREKRRERRAMIRADLLHVVNRERSIQEMSYKMGSYPFVQDNQFQGVWRKYQSRPYEEKQWDYKEWIHSHYTQMVRSMKQELATSINFKVFGKAKATFSKENIAEDKILSPSNSKFSIINIITNERDMYQWIAEFMAQLESTIEDLVDLRGSGWRFVKGITIDLQFNQYNAVRGSSH